MITLVDELYILAMEEAGGKLSVSRSRLRPALAGAVLAELVLQGRLGVSEAGRLEVVDAAETGEKILDEALRTVKKSKQPRKAGYWVKYFSRRPNPTVKLEERLTAEGFLEKEGNHFLWVIPAPGFPPGNASAQYWIKNRLRAAVLACEEADLHTLALLSMLFYGRLMSLAFTKGERKVGRQRIHQRIVAEALSNSNAHFIEEIGGAVKAF